MNIPSHWQTAFFKALVARGDIDLQVRYFEHYDVDRVAEGWPLDHGLREYEQYLEIGMSPEEMMKTVADARERIHIIGISFHKGLVKYFCKHGIAWCHWSEMPGYWLNELTGSRLPLYRLLYPFWLIFKKVEGHYFSKKAVGFFSQGVLAEDSFSRMCISRGKTAELFYCIDPLFKCDPHERVKQFVAGRRMFLSVGVLSRRKGTDLLIKAFARLDSSEWCLVLCGLDSSKGKFERLTRKLGISERVLFLGACHTDQIASVYSASDVFILASRFDGWGIVLNEAASIGLPLICSDRCGAAWHQIHEGANGYRIKAGSIDQLRKAMLKFVEQPESIETFAGFSRELFYQVFTPESNCQRLVQALSAWEEPEEKRKAPLRVVVQQPALPKYRVPFFRAIMNWQGARVKLLYSTMKGAPANEPAPDLLADYVPMKTYELFGKSFYWHSAQFSSAKRNVCDTLVLSWNTQYLSLIPALLRARMNGVRTVLWGHGYSKQEARVRRALRNFVASMADALVFYDFATADKFLAEGWPSQKIHVAANALDQTEIEAARRQWLDHPDKLHDFQIEEKLSGRKNILFIGRIYNENRLDLLIRALPRIVQEHSDIQLLIIGRVNEYGEELQVLAEELKIDHHIRWIGAIYAQRDLAPYMLSSLLLCYPANIGLSIIHAMSYGLPVLTGDQITSHNPEIYVLEESINGFTFKHLDVDDLANRMNGLLDDPSKIIAAGASGRDLILNKYTIDKMARGFMGAVGLENAVRDIEDLNQPLVSVVIPTYKRLDLLKRAVESVFDQTYKNWELVISDNESPAGETWEYLTTLASKHGNVTVLQNEAGGGCAGNINNALKNIRGEWIKPLFDDDTLMPNCLDVFVEAVRGHSNVVLAGCLAYRIRPGKKARIDKNPTRTGLEIVQQRHAHLAMYLQDFECGGVPSQMFVRKTAIDRGGFMPKPESIEHAIDSYWYAEILRHGDRMHLGLPLVLEYQGGHETLTSYYGFDVTEMELVTYRHDLYKYIPQEFNAPAPEVVGQMIHGIKGIYRLFILKQFKAGMSSLLSMNNLQAMKLVSQWMLRRGFPGYFTATPRARYRFSNRLRSMTSQIELLNATSNEGSGIGCSDPK